MPRKSSNANPAPKLPTFTLEKPVGKSKAVAKLSVPKVPVETLESNIQALIENAKENGIQATHCRASVTLY